MPITLPVEARPDDRSFDQVAARAEKRFAKAGQDSGKAFAKGLDDAAAKADPRSAERWIKAYDKVADAAGKVRVEEAKLQDLRDRGAANTRLIAQSEALERARRAETRATREAARAYTDLNSRASGFFSGIGSGIGSALSGTRFGGMIAGVQRLSSVFGGMGLAAGAAITGMAGLAVGIGAATTKLYQLGAQWDSVADSITARTGMMGDDLNRVMDQVSRVALDSASSISELGDIAGQVAALMGTSGDQVGTLTAYLADLNALTGEQTNIRQLAMLYRVFGITAGDQVGTLNDLYGAFTKTQIPINELVALLVKAGPTFKQYGMDIDQTVSMLTQFTEAGVDPERAVIGLSKALKTITDQGGQPSAVLAQVVAQIKELTAAGDTAGARQRAMDFFGAKSFQPFLDAIQSGKVSVEQLNSAMQQSDTDIRKIRGSTDDLTEAWQKFKNFLSVDLAPVAKTVFDALNHQLEWFTQSNRATINGIKEFWRALTEGPTGGYTATYPGQVISPAIPNGGGAIVPPSSGAITGNGTYLDSILGGGPGIAAPPGLLPPPGDATLPPTTPGSEGTGTGVGSGNTTLPYPAEYGQPPRPGETDQQYQARMADILAQYNLSQAQAQAASAAADPTTGAGDRAAANNAVIDARMRAEEASRRYQQSLIPQPGSIAVPLSPDFAAGPRPGQTSAQYSAESTYLDAQQKKAQAIAEEQQLMTSGTATANELTAAHNEVIRAQQNENEAALRLSEAYAKTSEQGAKMSGKLGEIGASLDADLGISKGLAGVAENITRFVANLAFAPMVGALKGVQASTGVDASKSGSGLIGMAAAAAGYGMPTASGQVSPLAAGGGRPGGGLPMAASGNSNLTAMFALAQRANGGSYGWGASDLVNGLADCSGAVSDLYEVLRTGTSTPARAFDTTAFASDAEAAKLGFQPGYMPGAFNVGVNPYPGKSGHMAATLPNGVNFESGGSGNGIRYGGDAAGALDPQFDKQYYLPVGGAAMTGAAASVGGQSFPVPLPVTIVGGAIAGTAAPAAPAATSPSPGSTSTTSGAGGTTSGSTATTAPSTTGGGYLPLTPDQLTNPVLTSPVPSGSGGSGGGGIATQLFPGLTGAAPSGRGGTGTGALFPGLAGPPQASTIGGIAPAGGRGQGGLGFGGGIAGAAMSALQSAAAAGGMAANGMAPGAGAAISAATDIGIKLANRTAQWAGQAAGIGVGGALEALVPVDSSLADPMNSWFGRIIGGMMGAAPALPNMAGQAANAPQNGQNTQQAAAGGGRPPITVNYTNNQAPEDRAGADLTNHLMAMNTGPGM